MVGYWDYSEGAQNEGALGNAFSDAIRRIAKDPNLARVPARPVGGM